VSILADRPIALPGIAAGRGVVVDRVLLAEPDGGFVAVRLLAERVAQEHAARVREAVQVGPEVDLHVGRTGTSELGGARAAGAHWLGALGTGLVVIAYVAQMTHPIKMRCGDGVSLGAYLLWCSASWLLCVYAIIAEEPNLIALQGYHAVACGVILFFGIRYRTSRCPLHQAAPASGEAST
jgi:hypothetical protein